jgi:hypothetical protein
MEVNTVTFDAPPSGENILNAAAHVIDVYLNEVKCSGA